MKIPPASSLGRIRFISLTALLSAIALTLLLPASWQVAGARRDSTGDPLPKLTQQETQLFNSGLKAFSSPWDKHQGLGPVYNKKDCAGCHLSPVVGGGASGDSTGDHLFGTTNPDGSFNPLTDEGGPLLQVHAVAGCDTSGEVFPPDATLRVRRVTPQLFGMGLINSIPDDEILAQAVDKGMGIFGVASIVPDESGKLRVGKFGYKAEFADLLQSVAESMKGEIGITNPISVDEDLPQGKAISPLCLTQEPNDPGSHMMQMFHFLVYLAPVSPSRSSGNGRNLFHDIGCALCHHPQYQTGNNVEVPLEWQGDSIISQALSNQPVHLYSDLLLHDMGARFDDGFPRSRHFRTMPLWGLGSRTAYLHDGRTSDLDEAIRLHGGEASQVIEGYDQLSPVDRADLIIFLKTL